MGEIHLLDCSLRDGGYRTDWHFSRERVQSMLDLDRGFDVRLVELGFLFPDNSEHLGPFSRVSNRLLSTFDSGFHEFGLMVEAKSAKEFIHRFDFYWEQISQFDFVRIAANLSDAELSAELSALFLEKRLKVFVNLMRASELRAQEAVGFFASLPPAISGRYLADSFGSLSPDKTAELFHALSSEGPGALGFHAHNNRSMALANVREAIRAGATFIDGTWAGHGRGSGNARLEELIVEVKPEKIKSGIAYSLGSHLEDYEYPDGGSQAESSFAYHFGASKGAHPNVVSGLLDPKRGLALGEVIELLLDETDGVDDSPNVNELLRFKNSTSGNKLTFSLPEAVSRVIVIGGSPNISDQLKEVELASYLDNVAVCSLNRLPVSNTLNTDFVFIVQPFRLPSIKRVRQTRHLTVVAPFEAEEAPGITCTSVPLGLDSDFSYDNLGAQAPQATCLAYALAVLAGCGVKEITLVGIGDGLSPADRVEESVLLEKFQIAYPDIGLTVLGSGPYSLPQARLWTHL